MATIDEAVKRVVHRQLAPTRVIGPTTEVAEDTDGDPMLRIDVAIEAAMNRLDPGEVAGLIRHVCKPLTESGTDHFPEFHFMAAEEAADAAARSH